MFSFANAAYIGLVDNGQFKLTVKEEHGPDELLCFVVEGGYIQTPKPAQKKFPAGLATISA